MPSSVLHTPELMSFGGSSDNGMNALFLALAARVQYAVVPVWQQDYSQQLGPDQPLEGDAPHEAISHEDPLQLLCSMHPRGASGAI